MGQLFKVDRGRPLYRQVYEILREQILRGHYRAGEPLLESQLAQDLAVSRTPIREALRQLEKDGLVQSDRYMVAINNPSPEEFVDLYLCRAALEQLVADRAARFRTDQDLRTMNTALRQADQAISEHDLEAVLQANTMFHDALITAAQMPRLRQLMDSIRGPILIARRHVLNQGEVFERQIHLEHLNLLEAVEAQNPDVAKERMELHMTNDISRGLAQFNAE